MKMQIGLVLLGLALTVGCASPSSDEGQKSSTSKMKYDDFRRSDNIADCRDRECGDPEPAPKEDPVDRSEGSLADQAGANDIGKSKGNGNEEGLGNDGDSFADDRWSDDDGYGDEGGYDEGGYDDGGYDDGGYDDGGGYDDSYGDDDDY